MNKESIRFFETVRDYFNTYLMKQRCVSENTVLSYRQAVNQYLQFLIEIKHLRFENLSFEDWNVASINEYMTFISTKHQVSASTRNQRLFALRAFLKYARMFYPEVSAISLDVQSIAIAREQKQPVGFLSEEAMACLLAEPDEHTKIGIRDMCFMVTMYDCAARDCEMLSLKLNSLCLNNNRPTIRLEGKGNKVRYAPLMKKTVGHLKRYIQIYHPETKDFDDYLFYTVIHGVHHHMSDDNVARFLKKYVNAARKKCPEVPAKVTPHQFRHSRAMHLYRNGMPLQLLSEFMGHASSQTTLIYAYADTEMKRKAIEKGQNWDFSTTPDNHNWKSDEDIIRKLYGLK